MIADRLQDLIDALSANPRVEVEAAEISRGLEEYALEVLDEVYGIHMPDSVLDIYRDMNGADIQWSSASIEPTVEGRVVLRRLQSVIHFYDTVDHSPWTDPLEEAERADYDSFRYVDECDYDIRVGFIISDSRIDDELYYLLRGNDGFIELDCGFEQYLDAMILSKGIAGWQRSLFYRDSETLRASDETFSKLQLVFPDEDVSAWPMDTECS